MAKITAIIGNPNCGKTTLFNALTGGKQKIGNWPGVTVEKKEGMIKGVPEEISIVDLPGIYSVSAHSEDEKIARDYLVSGNADLIINIVDSSNLERNLYLTMQLVEMQIPLIIVLNRSDIAESKKISIDPDVMSKLLGCPVVMISALKKQDVLKTADEISNAINKPSIPSLTVRYPEAIEKMISALDKKKYLNNLSFESKKWFCIRLLEEDIWALEKAGLSQDSSGVNGFKDEMAKLEFELDESPDIVIADSRYELIRNVTGKAVKSKGNKKIFSDMIDKVVLNRIAGIPFFLSIMYLLFWFTVAIGGAFIDFFDIAFGTVFVDGLSHLMKSLNSPEWLIAVLANGIGAGIQTVATFIPVIFTMFIMLSFLEDSGYMARAAFVMDRLMRTIGLPGKAFVPMIVGFGCTVPAVMGTRTLESKKDRILAIFMSPFMSCGAKLPVYVLFAAAFFPDRSGLMVFSLYITGIILAALTGYILKFTLLKGEASPFVMELPLYNMPRLLDILKHANSRLKVFLLRASKVIITAVFILSLLNTIGTEGSIGNEDTGNSVLSAVSKKITTVFIPMGIREDNWPASVSIFTGLFAKEAVVGTLNSLYGQIDESGKPASDEENKKEDAEESEEEFSFTGGIVKAFKSVGENFSGVVGGLTDPLGTAVLENTGDSKAIAEEVEVEESTFERLRSYFNQSQAYAYLLFILIYFPCIAAFGAIVKEMGLKLAVLQSAYMTVFGWIVATLFYQISSGHSVIWIIFPIVLMTGILIIFYILGKRDFAKLKV